MPTLPVFAASKTATWVDRHASRDLWDLWALNRLGAIDAAAENIYRRYCPTNKPPVPRDFTMVPQMNVDDKNPIKPTATEVGLFRVGAVQSGAG
ncbi:nucleotidyl transferase AbiEii/AbiGii toxin family protein, partial [Mycobacterium decipiens]|uniref:nucleotidyl transferase AbiEii/AbiGii toxin family protein n=1 Tax=Mycobacterium decipiens TaxID=1430326 RepID=UPI001F618E4E